MKKIAVFCSASFDIDPEYNEVARSFVRAASLRGFGIVTGGTVKGTMGVISDEMRANGGYHLGVIPRFMKQYVYPDLSEVIWTDTMAETPSAAPNDPNISVGNLRLTTSITSSLSKPNLRRDTRITMAYHLRLSLCLSTAVSKSSSNG